MSVSSDRKPTEKPINKPINKRDLRAGNQIQQWSMVKVNWLRSLLMISGDV